MTNRPPELEEFYKRHGKPLEVGMVVRFTPDNIDYTSNIDLEVVSIRNDKNYSNVRVCLTSGIASSENISPLDLEPI